MPGYQPVIEGVIHESLSMGEVQCDPEVSVTLVDNAAIRVLNSRYRHIDENTDVLSFPMYSSLREWPVSGQAMIGDIVISIEQALAQSEAYGHSIARELGFLTAHSMLHLMGYDHAGPVSETAMFELQEKILAKAGLSR